MNIPKTVLLTALFGAATFGWAQDSPTAPTPNTNGGDAVLMVCAMRSAGEQASLDCQTATPSDSDSSPDNGSQATPDDNNYAPSGDAAEAVISANAGARQVSNPQEQRSQRSSSRHNRASSSGQTQQQGDPNAPQNQIEYGGGGE